MAELKKIIGNEEILMHFRNGIAAKKVSHAYIINGPTGSGKTMLANYIATLLQCEEGGTEPCGQCHSCKQAANDNQPDILWVRHEKANSIGVDDIRTQIVEDVDIKPYSSRYKIYIIDEAEKMTIQAQNALLKTLEEPPEYVVILILTNNAAGFLPTILSRCVTLKVKPTPPAAIKSYLMNDHGISEGRANTAVAFAYGNIGKALRFAESDNFNELKNEMISVITYIQNMDAAEVMAAVKRAEVYKLEVYDYLDMMIAWFRDVLLYKASQDSSGLIFKDNLSAIKEQAIHASYAGIGQIVTDIEKAKTRLRANVSFGLTIELLYLSILENLQN